MEPAGERVGHKEQSLGILAFGVGPGTDVLMVKDLGWAGLELRQ